MSLSRWLAFPIPLSMRFSAEQYAQLRKGLSAEDFDDKWLGSWDAGCGQQQGSLAFNRSWTGSLGYVVPLKVEHGADGGCACSHFWVSLTNPLSALSALALLPYHRTMVSSLLTRTLLYWNQLGRLLSERGREEERETWEEKRKEKRGRARDSERLKS